MLQGVGFHLLIDGFSDKSLPRDAVQRWLIAMPEAIGMTPIDHIRIYRTSGGWAGMQIIAESHCSIHTNGKAVHIDVFSCKEFLADPAVELSVKMLGLEQVRTQTLTRGWQVPAEGTE